MFFKRFFSFSQKTSKKIYFGDRKPQFDKQKYYFLGIGSIFLGGYYILNLEYVPITGRKIFVTISRHEELEMSKIMARELESTHRLYPRFHQSTKFVQKVSNNLINRLGEGERKLFSSMEVNVIDSDEFNAFVIPGGRIYVFKGLLDFITNEDELAAVLGHEIGHQIARHSSQNMSFVKLSVELFLSFFFDVSFVFHPLIVQLMLSLPFSRKCENEADHIGLLLMSKACYDPHHAINLWRRVKGTEEFRIPEMLSTHPIPETRIKNLLSWLPEASSIYEGLGCYDYRRFGMFNNRIFNH
jgi:predicted Zn-dependent protease